ncbi:hypothetical protein ACWGLF_19510 [Streptomyces puniciscabiei]
MIDSYVSIKGQSSGDCKYTAGYRTLEQLANFRLKYPRGKIKIHNAPAGETACPAKVDTVSPRTVKVGGHSVQISGTWPSGITVYLDGKKVDLEPGIPDTQCCQDASVSFVVPKELFVFPTGTSSITVEITVKTKNIKLDAGQLTITSS